MAATIITYNDKFPTPHGEVKFDNGESVHLGLNRQGLVIKRIVPAGKPEDILFRGSPDLVGRLIAGLVDDAEASPLQILLTIVTQLNSADEVRQAFQHATEAVSS